ncbi:LuxR family transcriptional regulator [Solimonas sp. K1W22B-7]|uniref:helix-turn-helix domain-containing protein n=1 Tax=Solimonas sp. K1W22B-7 TaxID=2303331 RepID=UPI000E32F843|nr:helix-turn-helix transcriptional regulator [Solimonas sp. K1W22B-7]AXQ31060.1 LuxR family transcriptional regulator [Solimonas sp. K1W22B-7]
MDSGTLSYLSLAPTDRLTSRESQVMEALVEGDRLDELVNRFGVSPNTVKYHLKNIYAKLGVHSRRTAIHTYRSSRLQS